MTDWKHDEDYAETEVLPRESDAAEPDAEPTVVLGEDYRRRIAELHGAERDRDS